MILSEQAESRESPSDSPDPDEVLDLVDLAAQQRTQDDYALWPSGPRCLAGTRYTDADMYDDAVALGKAQFRADGRGRVYRKGLEPGRTWERHGSANAGCWAEDAVRHPKAKHRRVLRKGKRPLVEDSMMMPPGTWHIETEARWSESRDFGLCDVCGALLAAGLPPGRQKYCFVGDCARIGANAARRANRYRKRHPRFRRDADGWYINAAIPPIPEAVPDNPYVHRFEPWPVFEHHRITPPWAGRTHRIVDLRTGRVKNPYRTVTILDQRNGRFVSKDEGTSRGRITNVVIIPDPRSSSAGRKPVFQLR